MRGLSSDTLRTGLDALAEVEPAIAAGLARAGYPAPRLNPPGYQTLVRTIVGQQVSISAARAVNGRLEALLGEGCPPSEVLAADDAALRGVGLSRQKMGYLRSLAELVGSGALDLAALPADDEAAIAQLVRIKGIGRWSAEIYLLFAEGRPDIWPAGDLAVRIEIGHLMGHPDRPSEAETRAYAEPWRPHRGAAALFAWHHYAHRQAAAKDKMPL